MVEDCSIDIMQEILDEGDIDALKELLEENIKPLILYRVKKEKEIAKQAIDELYQLEQEAV